MNTVNNNILEYITDKYAPICVILYGSYADGSNGPDAGGHRFGQAVP